MMENEAGDIPSSSKKTSLIKRASVFGLFRRYLAAGALK